MRKIASSKIGRDPLTHFLAAGSLIFALQSIFSPPAEEFSRNITVGRDKVEELKRDWSGRWGRSPGEEELKALVGQYVDEEVLYREAKRLRLDHEDTIVRRRLVQKMEFLHQDTQVPREPGEEEIQRAIAKYPASYRNYGESSLRHLAKLHVMEESRDRANQRLIEQLRSRYQISVESEK